MATSTAQKYEEKKGKEKYDKEYWMSYTKEKFEGANGITELTKMPVVDDAITIDVMLINKKVYDMMNRLARRYRDWETVQT